MALTRIVAATLIALAAAGKAGLAEGRSDGPHKPDAHSQDVGPAAVIVVALREQRVTVYDAAGRSLRAPVSTGQPGYETPAGVYSIIGKKVEHTSNLYEDAPMPFMQRLTWSGIALHAGVLPGRPASHGCVRLPYAFAERLYDLTKLGTRVLIVRNDIAPVEIAHPLLFKPLPATSEVSLVASAGTALPPPTVPQTLRSIAEAKTAAAEAATRRAEEARRAAWLARSEVAQQVRAMRMAAVAVRRAEAHLRITEEALEAATTLEAKQEAEKQMAEALNHLTSAQTELEAVSREEQPKKDALELARQQAVAAEAERVAAVEEARDANKKLRPVTVFVSRSTQRLYVRQNFEPLFDMPVEIASPDEPIGTYVFTALELLDDDADLRWNAISMYPGSEPKRRRGSEAVPAETDVAAAKQALERISFPDDAVRRISEIVTPGSSLIISDEEMSKETSTGTDFIVLMSGEPQGGIKIRQRRTPVPRYRLPYPRPPSSWW